MTTTKINPNQTNDYILSNSLSRQAIINGNFDVWQRGTSFIAGFTANFTADRWFKKADDHFTVSRQDGTGVSGSNYCLRASHDNGSTAGTLSLLYAGIESQDAIKFRGKKLTLSFYARKGANFSASGSNLNVKLTAGTGTDESFKTNASYTTGNTELIPTTTSTLTTSWQKFTVTTTDVLASNISEFSLNFNYTSVGTSGAADYFEITQVQLCAGDVALPFMPKSFEEELRACQRYYEKSYDYTIAQGTNSTVGLVQVGSSVDTTGKAWVYIPFKVNKRITPTTVNIWIVGGTASQIEYSANGATYGASANYGIERQSTNAFCINATGKTAGQTGTLAFHYAVDVEL